MHVRNNDSTKPHVVVIEEINRGNPAQIFGEMLTLLEADKRGPEHALTLLYGDDDDPFSLPENLYVIGTMNQADRSLAMMDMALRRRFAFVTLTPQLNQRWKDYCTQECRLDPDTLDGIAARITQVNQLIAEDYTLGDAYLIGHSYVTPKRSTDGVLKSPEETQAWFERIISSELHPLLEEYWFDNPEKLREALDVLRS